MVVLLFAEVAAAAAATAGAAAASVLPVHPTPGAPPAARVAPVTAPTAAPHLLTPPCMYPPPFTLYPDPPVSSPVNQYATILCSR